MKRVAHNGLVGGSSPSGPTIVFKHLPSVLRRASKSGVPNSGQIGLHRGPVPRADRVVIVLRPGSKPQMSGVAAGRVAAAMQDKALRHLRLDRSVHDVVRNAVRTEQRARHFEAPVAVTRQSAIPFPAGIGTGRRVNFGPESGDIGFGKTRDLFGNSHGSILAHPGGPTNNFNDLEDALRRARWFFGPKLIAPADPNSR